MAIKSVPLPIKSGANNPTGYFMDTYPNLCVFLKHVLITRDPLLVESLTVAFSNGNHIVGIDLAKLLEKGNALSIKDLVEAILENGGEDGPGSIIPTALAEILLPYMGRGQRLSRATPAAVERAREIATGLIEFPPMEELSVQIHGSYAFRQTRELDYSGESTPVYLSSDTIRQCIEAENLDPAMESIVNQIASEPFETHRGDEHTVDSEGGEWDSGPTFGNFYDLQEAIREHIRRTQNNQQLPLHDGSGEEYDYYHGELEDEER
jgi:hypothetical protein